jgi:endonuclease/exonuclease/phosphatase family metal-dependent hydrolase
VAKSFSKPEWKAVFDLLDADGPGFFRFPRRRVNSLIIGSFNIRKLGEVAKRSDGAWQMIERIVAAYDLIGIQEVMDDTSGLLHLKDRLGDKYSVVLSDATGVRLEGPAPVERLAFLYRNDRVEAGELASDLTYDRGQIYATLFDRRGPIEQALKNHAADLQKWEVKAAANRAAGKRAPKKPTLVLPTFLSFIRTPHCVSFRIPGGPGTKPYEFLAANAHLLYGSSKEERWREFRALIDWLSWRAKNAKRMYRPDVILMGDMNFNWENPEKNRPGVEKALTGLNKNLHLRRGAHGKLYFPLLDTHPTTGQVVRTNARLDQTFDQIAFIGFDQRLPSTETPIAQDPDGFDYGAFNFVDLFAQAIHQRGFAELTKAQRKTLLSKFEFDLSDHMPIWVRLPLPN